MTQWVPVATADEIPEGARKIVKLNDVPVAVFHKGGNWYAIQNVCPHRGGPVGEGHLEGDVVTCPWHGWKFDITTGLNPLNPAASVHTFDVKVEGDEVYLNPVPREKQGAAGSGGGPGLGLGRR